ncbi:MAG: tetratricopeptide repeat protein [Caldilineae bacterium]|nr:MAG: tetratricopeptide repeat protein [Caldilineae bacterium]
MAITMTFDPTALFNDYVKNNVEYALQRLQTNNVRTPPLTDQELALQALAFSLNLASSWPLTRRLLLALAPKMEQSGHRQEWHTYLLEGLHFSQQAGDRRTEAELRFHLGLLYQLMRRFDDAEKQYEQALELFKQLDETHGQARTLNRLAIVARQKRRFDLALARVEEAESLLAPDDTERAYCYLVRGSLCHDRREWAEAAGYFRRSLELSEKKRALREMAWGHANLGMALRHLEQMEESEHHLKQAISLFDDIGDPVNKAISLMNLGNLYLTLEEPEKALDCYRQAEPIFRETQDIMNEAKVCNNIGMAYRHLKRWNEAVTSYVRSVTLWRQLDNPVLLENALLGLAIAYLSQDHKESARPLLKEAESLLEEIQDPRSQDFFRQELDECLKMLEGTEETAVVEQER